MSVDNKALTDKQIQDAYIFIDGIFSKSTEFDHGLFSEWLSLKTILDDEGKEVEVAKANLYLFNGNQVDFYEAADSIDGDQEFIASKLLNVFQINSSSRIAIIDNLFVNSEKATAKTKIKLLDEQILPYLYDRGFDYAAFLNASICYKGSRLEQETTDNAFENEIPMIREIGESEKWGEGVNLVDLEEYES
ncbi:hypothetical protein H5S40_00625 [Limosilactobacillus sp. RRLNB_1_1]|uniref:Uncharacterized protein n=1 Tax=Limosilactobacillus albertensis TaxID=2759752 RepID=A0A7W3TQI1_9LACO|nr:hypothetical protein [Limosilactobacillus albertensis]MBB1068701.1 hypothetical protein [Limosilactobacillus albertensis]MCD7118294.1 hypothetical protein [Limosilactobacillus albertensis]MCD7129208.1 hypothetical protein [Limosilactobacillus albertensis]